MASSTLGTFLRAFTFGHVRQLDRVLDVALALSGGRRRPPERVCCRGSMSTASSARCSTCATAKGAANTQRGFRQSQAIRELIAKIPETDCVTIGDYPETGGAQIAETRLGDLRLIMRRTRLVGDQAELWLDWGHHAFATNRKVPLLVSRC
jgi:hypothetical protein